MAELTKYIFMITGISLMFYLAGLINSNPLIDFLLSPQNLYSSIWSGIIIISLSSVSAIFVGYITKDMALTVMTALAPALLSILWNIGSVYIKIAASNPVIATIIFAPSMFYLIWLFVDWWRGR
jgi:hypothetical protein